MSSFVQIESRGMYNTLVKYDLSMSDDFLKHVLSIMLTLNCDWAVSFCRCCHCCKLFTFSFSSPEPLGKFQPNLAKAIRS